MRYCYHARTNRGLQEVLAAELRALSRTDSRIEIRESPDGVCDAVHLLSPVPIPWERFAPVRCAYEVVEIRSAIVSPGLEAAPQAEALRVVRARSEEADFREIRGNETFAVRCIRRGDHTIARAAVEREIGSVIVARTGCAVDLSAPRRTVRVYLYGDTLYVGLLINPHPMDRRFEWLYRPRVALNPVVAAALLHYALRETPGARRAGDADTRRIEGILDPFCGSGTIPLEAADDPTFRRCRMYASDVAPEAIAGTRANLAAQGLLNRVQVRRADAMALERFYAGRDIDTIVCDPPLGVRLGRRLDFGRLYGALLDGASTILPAGGRMVLMSSRRRGLLNRVIASRTEWRILHVRVIETGGVFPGIFVLQYR